MLQQFPFYVREKDYFNIDDSISILEYRTLLTRDVSKVEFRSAIRVGRLFCSLVKNRRSNTHAKMRKNHGKVHNPSFDNPWKSPISLLKAQGSVTLSSWHKNSLIYRVAWGNGDYKNAFTQSCKYNHQAYRDLMSTK